MKPGGEGVNIKILGKEFMVACPPSEQQSLSEAANYLDGKMRAIQKSGKVIDAERCAIMAALNITNDLLQIQRNSGDVPKELGKKLRFLQSKIEAALQQ
ncbi:MAG: cell division protein ZapA [Gammaproteobacteria bacterium]|nr:cell division protein ZapA [Gammaproteobacteria bacterium]